MKGRLFLLLACAGLLAYSAAFAISAKGIIQKSEKAVRGDSLYAEYKMTVKTRRWKRTMELRSWEVRKGRKSFSEITAPKKDAGNRFLLRNGKMWQYVPKLGRVIKISPSMMLQSWMGSDFTNDDIVKESSIVKDYHHTLLGKETVDGHSCYKLKLSPKKDAAVVWGKIIYYARTSDYLPVKEEFYNERDDLKKVLSFSQFKRMDDRVIPTMYTMNTIRKKDRYTKMEIVKADFNVNIPASVFTTKNLKRR